MDKEAEVAAPEVKEPPAEKPKLLSEANAAERDAIADRYAAHEDGGKPKVEDFKPEGEPEIVPETTPVVEKTEDEPEEAPAEPEATPAAVDKKEKKTVPIEALHEARNEMKSLKKDNQELKEQVKILLEDIRSVKAKPADAPAEEEEFLTDDQKKLRTLEKEVEFIRAKDKEQEKTREAENIKTAQEKIGRQIREASESLEKEGYQGFTDMLPLVTVELQRLASEDRDAAIKLDNPEGWKKIFKETIFPKVSALSQKKAREEKKAGKEALKEGASLLMPSGSQPAPKEDKEDDYSFDSYMKDRASRSPQPQNLRGK